MVFTTVISSFVQLALALVLPVAWWAVATRRRVEFATWIGLVVPEWKAKRQRLVLALMVWAVVAVLSVVLLSSAAGGTASSRFAGSGIYGAIAVLFYAFIQTGLSEEILFRGFLGKKLSEKFGFGVGNTVQAVVFGLVHVILLSSAFTLVPLIGAGVLTAVSGWIMGGVNEEAAGGSILPSWVMHSLANLLVGWGAVLGFLA